MPQAMKEWRRNASRRLKIALGGECAVCHLDDLDKLTIDHIEPLTEEQRAYRVRIGANSRLVLYRKEKDEGLIRLLCPKCQRNTQQRQLDFKKKQNENTPF